MSAVNVEISVGTTVGLVAAQPATEDAAGYGALTFVTVGEVTNIGESGGSAQVATFTPVESGTVNKRKGSIDYGTASLSIAKDASDAGQVLLKAGFDGTDRSTIHSFAITEDGGEVTYFMGLISSFTTARGDANTVLSHNCNIERTTIAVVA